ncbi:Synaptotagmin-1 [Platysternon megacephalum]|uniref:Synaptotagmin-1 n=1 Tax=Platysternon megacephalum TaxID=55544 RepID=A0A4D9EK85_9SAUR|nr:Synaptotagmin-1 [Platysternon megacephalum]
MGTYDRAPSLPSGRIVWLPAQPGRGSSAVCAPLLSASLPRKLPAPRTFPSPERFTFAPRAKPRPASQQAGRGRPRAPEPGNLPRGAPTPAGETRPGDAAAVPDPTAPASPRRGGDLGQLSPAARPQRQQSLSPGSQRRSPRDCEVGAKLSRRGGGESA